MANLGPLFAATNPPEERKLAKKVEVPPEAHKTVVIDGKEARINWTSLEGRTEKGEYYEAGISFNVTDHSVWKLRKEADGSWTPIRCALYGRRDLTGEQRAVADKFTRKI